MLAGIFRRLRYLFDRDEFAGDLREEIELHVDLRARRLADQGVPAGEARMAARRRFGNRAMLEDASAAQWGFTAAERLLQDVRQAVRTLRKSPGLACFAIFTLAAGLGVNTAIFSIVNTVMLRGLPYPDADRLVSLWEVETRSRPGGKNANSRTTVAVANLLDYRKRSAAFEGLAAYDDFPMNLTGLGLPERISGQGVTANFFSVLGIAPAQGRALLPEDDTPEAQPVVIVAHEFWRQRLGADPAALGRFVSLDARPHRIVGILPAGFRSPEDIAYRGHTEFFVPAAYPRQQLQAHGDHDVNVVARLKPGASLAAAQSQLDAVSAQLGEEFPSSNRDIRAVIAPLRDDLVRGVRDSLYALLGASALIVLITCVNVANLLLVRAIARHHETSVRFALGANRARVIRQFLAESLLIAAAGCVAGLALGVAMERLLVALAPASLPRLDAVAMDWRVFAAATLIATLTGAIFGLAPAWQASTAKAADALRTATRNTSARPQVRWRSILTSAQVTLSMVLLIGAGLLLKSFITLAGVDLGFQPSRIVAVNIQLPEARYNNASERLRFFEQLEPRVRALAGVEAVTYANRMPLRGGWGGSTYLDSAPEAEYDSDYQAVSPGYFDTIGLKLLRGRLLTPADREGQIAAAVVNQAFAREYLDGADPVGHRFRHDRKGPWVTIAGMVTDIRRGGKAEAIKPEVYLPAAQTGLYPVRLADFAVRAAGDPLALVAAIRREVLAVDKDQPITNVATFDQIIDQRLAERRFQTVLLLIFAALAVGLATVGVFGVLSYSVTQRTAELGIRIALGAGRRQIAAMVLRQAAVLIGAGVAAGLAGAFALSTFIATLLFQVRPHDAGTYAAAVAILVVVALAASLIPARRGAAIDPIVAVRYE